LKRRSAIEPIFGHLKSDNRLERNLLKGKDGYHINAVLAACGFNLMSIAISLEENSMQFSYCQF
jgi:IS5 family transposase